MKFVPIIFLKKRKIYLEQEEESISIETLKQQFDEHALVYVFDYDGIEGDRPNLCLFPKLSQHIDVWADIGPRTLGDVVDLVLTGVSQITLRKNRWPTMNISDVRELTENKIFLTVDEGEDTKSNPSSSILSSDGFVCFQSRKEIDADFSLGRKIKEVCSNNVVYAVECNPGNISYWGKKGVTGLLTYQKKIKEFSKIWEMKKKLLSDSSSNEVEKTN